MDWFQSAANWWFLVLAVGIALSGIGVVAARNIIHAALFLVGALAGTAGLFMLLGAPFVGWVLVLVYIGAVVVMFLFGIMITQAPTGRNLGLDHPRRLPAAFVAAAVFVVLTFASVSAFGGRTIADVGSASATDLVGTQLMGRFVLPFEVVSFVLLGALIGAITLAKRDASPGEEERRLAAEAEAKGGRR